MDNILNPDFIKWYLLLRQKQTRNKSVFGYISLKEIICCNIFLIPANTTQMRSWKYKCDMCNMREIPLSSRIIDINSLANIVITFLTCSVPNCYSFHLKLDFNWKPCDPWDMWRVALETYVIDTKSAVHFWHPLLAQINFCWCQTWSPFLISLG